MSTDERTAALHGELETITSACPTPVDRPIMLQGWRDLASVHWPYDPDAVQRLLPPGLNVDLCDGRAWVGLIPFHMRRIRAPGLPALGVVIVSRDQRADLRRRPGRSPGRLVLQPRCSPAHPRGGGPVTYGLPYCWSAMSITHSGRDHHDVVEYGTRRRWPQRGAESRLAIEIGRAIDEDDLDEVERFLTARWALASMLAGRELWAEIDHEPWPLHRARLLHCQDSLIAAAGLPDPVGDPVVLWSPGVEVRIGRPKIRQSVVHPFV